MESKVNAGEFVTWIEEFTRTMKGVGEGNVPCGDCVGCCTSSKFIHIKPSDNAALKSIPEELMFQAPGLEKGHFLLGYDEKGYCPMYKTGKCSIYESRPETCRQYDCRVMAASNLEIFDESREIIARVNSWEFEFTSTKSIALSNAVKLAVSFLTNNANKFPAGFIPPLSAQIAVMGIRVHALFLGHTMDSAKENSCTLIDSIVKESVTGN